jgi:hypothetical protein
VLPSALVVQLPSIMVLKAQLSATTKEAKKSTKSIYIY